MVSRSYLLLSLRHWSTRTSSHAYIRCMNCSRTTTATNASSFNQMYFLWILIKSFNSFECEQIFFRRKVKHCTRDSEDGNDWRLFVAHHDSDLSFAVVFKVLHVVHGQDNGVVSDFIESFAIVFARKVDYLKAENVEISRRQGWRYFRFILLKHWWWSRFQLELRWLQSIRSAAGSTRYREQQSQSSYRSSDPESKRKSVCA